MSKMWFIVFKKELKDFFREKKTVFMTIFFPLVLMVAMIGLSITIAESQNKEITEKFTISLKDEGNSEIGEYIKGQKGIKLVDKSDLSDAVEDGVVKVGIEIPKDFDIDIKEGKEPIIDIYYDNISQGGTMALSRITEIINSYKNNLVREKLATVNLPQSTIDPIKINALGIKDNNEESTDIIMILAMCIPSLILIGGASGIAAISSDIGAGEKERGTLEPLLTTKAGRSDIVLGKLLTCTVIGVINSIVTVGSIFGGLKLLPEILDINIKVNIGIIQIMEILVLSISLSLFFSAILLTISFFSKSYKEAQTFTSFAALVPMVPAMILMYNNVRNVAFGEFFIPIYNVGLVIKMLIMDVSIGYGLIVVLVTSIIYAIIALIITKLALSREEVIFRG